MFFQNCLTTDEIKKEYYRLAKLHHPDVGGDTLTMQQINAAYEKAMESAKRVEMPGRKEGFYYYASQTSKRLAKAIDFILKFDNIDVEICGDWLWVGGKTFPIKDSLNNFGFVYAAGKRKWFYAGRPSNNVGRHLTMDEIRNLHGSKKLKSRKDKAEPAQEYTKHDDEQEAACPLLEGAIAA